MSTKKPEILIPIWGAGGDEDNLAELRALAVRYPSVSLVRLYRRLAQGHGRTEAVAMTPERFIAYAIHTALADRGAIAETGSPWWSWDPEGQSYAPPLLSSREIREELALRARRAGITVRELRMSAGDVTALLALDGRVLVTRRSFSRVLLDTGHGGLESLIQQIADRILPYRGGLKSPGQRRVWQALMHSPAGLVRGAGTTTHIAGVGGAYDVVLGLGQPHKVQRLGTGRALWAYAGRGFLVVRGDDAVNIHGGEPLVQYHESTPSGEIRDRVPALLGSIPRSSGTRGLQRALTQIALPLRT